MLSDLWYGSVDPSSDVSCRPEYRAAAEDAAEVEEKLFASEVITTEQVKALKLAYAELSAVGRETAFMEGVKLGVRFCFEALSAEFS